MLTILSITLLLNEPPRVPWGGNDFVQYYAGAKLLMEGRNPYDRTVAGALQMELGRLEPLETFAPPWAILPALPLIVLPFSTAIVVNITLQAALLALCAVAWWWMLFPGRPQQGWIALLVLPLWLPTLMMLGVGQNTVWPLTGLTGWLWFVNQRKPRLACVCLVLLIIKPHLGLMPGLFILGYWLRRRDWRSLLVYVTALLLVTGFTVALRPTIWYDYVTAMQTGTPAAAFSTATWNSAWQDVGRWVHPAAYLVWGVMLIAAVVLGGITTANKIVLRLAVVATVAMAVVPYGFSFDLVLMLPLFLAGVGYVISERPYARLVMLGWAGIIGLLVAGKLLEWNEAAYWGVAWLGLGISCISMRQMDISSPVISAPASS